MGRDRESEGTVCLLTGEERPALLARSRKMRAFLELVEKVATSLVFALLEGESGTGKELVARALHFYSPRRSGPFVALNCAAVSETLLESEVFGHVPGAFTGAVGEKPGIVELANGGTLFLDEVHQMSPAMQAKFLRWLEEGEFRRVGDTVLRRVDVAVIAAANEDLWRLVQERRFRLDLYYRLKGSFLKVPPLRNRREDILLLARAFLTEHAAKFKRTAPNLSAMVKSILLGHSWPGNVRELRNCIRHAVATCQDGKIVPENVRSYLNLEISSVPKPRENVVERLQRKEIEDALERHRGNMSRAAQDLGVHRNTLRRRMKKYGLL